jgi:hypothetical protein
MSEAAAVLLWGGRGSGKSGFLGALWHAGGAHDDAIGRWCISPGDIHDALTKNYLIDAYTMLREGHRRATMPAADYPSLRMTARKWVGGSPRAALEVSFKDPAGEYADDPLRAREQGGPLLDELRHASGVVWLFDCLAESRPQLDQIIRQLGSLRQRSGGSAIDTPVAFCLSRIDLLSEDVRAWLQREPEAGLRETLGEDIMAQLEGAFPRRKYFAISSRGYTTGVVQPEGLNDVLNWIHANQRRERLGHFARRWGRHAAVAVLLVFAAWAAATAVRDSSGADADQRALGQLELAGRMYADGDHDSALAVLRAIELPADHPRGIELDTLLAFVAHNIGSARALSGADADSLLALAQERSERAARQLRDPAAAARVRYVHAEACMLRKCDASLIRNDLDFIIANSPDRLLVAEAKKHRTAIRK